MKLDARARRWTVWVALLLGAAWLAVFGDRTPSTNEVVRAVQPLVPPTTASSSSSPETKQTGMGGERAVLNAPVAREWLYPDRVRERAGRPIFVAGSWTPPPPPPPPPPRPLPAPPPPPPTAPPLPLTFIGKKFEKGQWEVFVSHGERIHVLKATDVIDGLYRVDAVQPPRMDLTYLPLNQAQQLDIGALP